MRTINRMLRGSLVLLSASGVAASAQVTVGTAVAGNGNCIPVGCTLGGNEYQQVYSSTAFSGPFNIGSFSFFHTIFNPGSGVYAAGTYDFFFGTTTKAVNGLDVTFANNESSLLSFFATVIVAPGTSAAPSTF